MRPSTWIKPLNRRTHCVRDTHDLPQDICIVHIRPEAFEHVVVLQILRSQIQRITAELDSFACVREGIFKEQRGVEVEKSKAANSPDRSFLCLERQLSIRLEGDECVLGPSPAIGNLWFLLGFGPSAWASRAFLNRCRVGAAPLRCLQRYIKRDARGEWLIIPLFLVQPGVPSCSDISNPQGRH
jgi:hypothetical protein